MLAHSDDDLFFMKRIADVIRIGLEISEHALLSTGMQKLMKEETFDLFIFEGLSTDALLGIAAHFNIPSIAISSLEATPLLNALIGNPRSMSFVPNSFLGYQEPMNFKQRVINFFMSAMWELITQYTHYLNYEFYEYVSKIL